MSFDIALLRRITSLIDYTRLKEHDTETDMAIFFSNAETDFGNVAAVCVYPQYVRFAHTMFAAKSIKVASVANFPSGNAALEKVLIEINGALEDGAQEIDVVFPYQRYLSGEQSYADDFVAACKAACDAKAILKVILETGAFKDNDMIANASRDVLLAGADFIKTSTGKISMGATLEAATIMLSIIKDLQGRLHRPLGLKISGGIKTVVQATSYIQLADEILGSSQEVNSANFRIGASQLLEDIHKQGILYESTIR